MTALCAKTPHNYLRNVATTVSNAQEHINYTFDDTVIRP